MAIKIERKSEKINDATKVDLATPPQPSIVESVGKKPSLKIERKKIDVNETTQIELGSSIHLQNEDVGDKIFSEGLTEIPKKKVLNKHHLPVLNINKPDYWPSVPLKDRKHLTDELAAEMCLGNCCGFEGLKAGCCQVDPEDIEHVLGYVEEKDIQRLLKHLRKSTPGIKREDVVIDKEEGMILGKKFFNDHPVFKQDKSYPMLRLQIFGSKFVCKFLSLETFKCTVYSSRPEMCSQYYCQWMKSNFLLRTKDRPNTWQKIR